MLIQVDQVWCSPDTGNRFRVVGLVLGTNDDDGKVRVERLPGVGQTRLPKWEGDGRYVFVPSQFRVMQLEGEPMACDHCNALIESVYGIPGEL